MQRLSLMRSTSFTSSNHRCWIYGTGRVFDFSFGAQEEDELSIEASEDRLEPSESGWLGWTCTSSCYVAVWGWCWDDGCVLLRQLRALGWSGLPHPIPSALGWMIGSWGRSHAPKCTRSWCNNGRHLSLLEHSAPATPFSPPSMAVEQGGIWRSPKWTEWLQSIFACKTPLPGGANRDSCPGHIRSPRSPSPVCITQGIHGCYISQPQHCGWQIGGEAWFDY